MSVALATYNGEAFLRPLLESLACQSRRPDELVVSDDGSSDQTLQILADFAAEAPFNVIILKNSADAGILNNFYTAFAGTSSDIIFYCDQDDVWHPDKIEQVAREFSDPAVSAVIHRSRIVTAELEDTGQLVQQNEYWGKLRAPVDCLTVHGFGHQMAIRRSVYDVMSSLQKGLTGTKSIYANNFDRLIPFCASITGKIVMVRDPLVDFRRHGQSATTAGKDVRSGQDWKEKAEWLATGYADSVNLCADAQRTVADKAPLLDCVFQGHQSQKNAFDSLLKIANSPDAASGTREYVRALSLILSSRTAFSNSRATKNAALAFMLLVKRITAKRVH